MTTPSRHRIDPRHRVDLDAIDPAGTPGAPGDRDATEAATEDLRARLVALQVLLHAEHRHRVLVVLQGMDTSGKGGTIRKVLSGVNPAGVRVVSFRAPDDVELSRDYLWRVHAHVPADGELVVFDRSHYEDVLAVAVRQLAPESRWRRRFAHIRDFESMLVDEGTTLVKVMLHISRNEQRARLQARLADPTKRWKFDPADLVARRAWSAYRRAYEEALTETSTDAAPWHVVPADHKWYRNWAVASLLVSTLEGLGMTWPEPEGLDGLTVE